MIDAYTFHYPKYIELISSENDLTAIPIYEDDTFSILDFAVNVKEGDKPPVPGVYNCACFDFPIHLAFSVMNYDFSKPLPGKETRVITYLGIG